MRIVNDWLRWVLVAGIATSAPAKDYFKLGSWSIDELGERIGQTRFAVSEHLRLAGVDILAVQDIRDTDGPGAPYRNDRLEEALSLLNEREADQWRYSLFPARDPNASRGLLGFLWNESRVSLVGGPEEVLESDLVDATWRTLPCAAQFRSTDPGKGDIVVVNVQLTPDLPGESAVDSDLRRALQTEALGESLETVRARFSDEDIVIVGDFQSQGAGDFALEVLAGYGFRDLNGDDATTYVRTEVGRPFDRIWVPLDQPEFRYSEQFVMLAASPRRFARSLSDHFLVLTPIQNLDDDDFSEPDTDVVENDSDGDSESEVVSAYYASVPADAEVASLREALHRLIRNNRRLSYGELWDALAYTDENPDDPSEVVLFYTGWTRDEDDHGGAPDEWNREHVWAKSKGDFGTRPGAGTDLHHIRPTDVSVNSKRGSLSFDEGGEVYIDPDGPSANRVDGDSWEPRDEVKGDVARMIF